MRSSAIWGGTGRFLLVVTTACVWAGCNKGTSKTDKQPPKPVVRLVTLPLQATGALRRNAFDLYLVANRRGVSLSLKSPASNSARANQLTQAQRQRLDDVRRQYKAYVARHAMDGKILPLTDKLRVAAGDKRGGNPNAFLIKRLQTPLNYCVSWSKTEAATLGLEWTPTATLFLHPKVPYRTVTELVYTLGQSRLTTFQFAVKAGGTVRGIAVSAPKYRNLPLGQDADKPSIRITVLLNATHLQVTANETRGPDVRLKRLKTLEALRSVTQLKLLGVTKTGTKTPPSEAPKDAPKTVAPKPFHLDERIPMTKRGTDRLLALYQLIMKCRKRTTRLELVVSARPAQRWQRLARVLAAATVIRQGSAFKTVEALLSAPPITGKNARIPALLSVVE